VKELPKVESDTKRKPSFKEKQEYDKLQEDIASLEKQKEMLTASISGGSTDHQQLQKWSQEIQNITDQIEQKTLRWLELAEIM
jgi:ATP-binding cassette subfamily F protein uup